MNKRQARQVVIRRLRSIQNQDWPVLYAKLYRSSEWQNARTVAVTLSTRLELNTEPIINHAITERKSVVVPKVFPHRMMQFYRMTDRTRLVTGAFGIREPVARSQFRVSKRQIDLIIVPGLAFTSAGDRLGFGGGYYDRYLKCFTGDTVALARPKQFFREPFWPVASDDVRVHHIISYGG